MAHICLLETDWFYDGAVYALIWNGKTVIKKVYRGDEGLPSTLTTILFAPYEDEPKIVGIVVGTFFPTPEV